MQSLFLRIFILISTLSVITGCTRDNLPSQTLLVEPTPYPIENGEQTGLTTPYPGWEGPQVWESTPYPGAVDLHREEPEYSTEEVEPIYGALTGALRIQLVYAEDGAPIRGQIFYLAEWLTIPNMPDAGVPALDMANSPHGETNINGFLVLSNLLPKRYSLVLYTPEGTVLVPDAESHEDVWVEITANALTDMGTIKVPIPKSRLER